MKKIFLILMMSQIIWISNAQSYGFNGLYNFSTTLNANFDTETCCNFTDVEFGTNYNTGLPQANYTFSSLTPACMALGFNSTTFTQNNLTAFYIPGTGASLNSFLYNFYWNGNQSQVNVTIYNQSNCLFYIVGSSSSIISFSFVIFIYLFMFLSSLI